MRNSAPKEKSLTIHIATDYIGPNGLPLVYGSTPDKVGVIKGSVRFSTNYECRGKNIVILYEAKAEAQWTAFENKKVVQHQTEEILGHHIWHFPLEHTKPGGKKIMPGSYTKEFEIPLVHPSLQNKSLTHTPNTPIPSSLLLPSSSNNPQARIKYTIRALLRRPFPTIHNIESTQEVWVLQSSLPLPALKRPQHPDRYLPTIDSFDSTLSAYNPLQPSINSAQQNNSNHDQNNSNSNINNNESNHHPEQPNTPSISTKEQESSLVSHNDITPVRALSESTKVLKSYLSMIPTFDFSRSKHFLSSAFDSLSETSKPSEKTLKEALKDEKPISALPSPLPDTYNSNTSESESLTDSSTSSSSVESSSSLRKDKLDIDEISSSDDGDEEEEEEDNPANYTGVWEPFRIPYSLSLPSETVHLGQSVPITIQFGSNKHHRRKSHGLKKKKMERSSQGGNEAGDNRRHHHHHHHHRQSQELEASPNYRFVVKKGILKIVEHTHLKEFMVTPPTLNRQHKSNPAMAGLYASNNTTNTSANNIMNALPPSRVSTDLSKRVSINERQFQPFSQINQKITAQELSPEHIPGIATLPEQKHNTKLIDHFRRASHHEGLGTKRSTEELQMHQHSHSESNDIRRFFNPKRHSVDVASRHTPTLALGSLRGTQTPNVQSPTTSLFSHNQPANTRIINSIEAKFKTEVITISLTPHLQQRELQYQRRLNKKALQHHHDMKNQRDEDHGDSENKEGRQVEGGKENMIGKAREGGNVWKTTIWFQIPGPSELATFTETKHIVKKHTLQLILLCGLVDDSNEEEINTEVGLSRESSIGSVITEPGINKEFRLEMDLHVTGPRAPE